MAQLLDAVAADPWGAIRSVVGEPLHPGGHEATESLLDRAAVGPDTRLLDVGSGAGSALRLARERGATAVGLDRRAAGGGMVKGDLAALPVAASSADVVLAECVFCLAEGYDRSAREAARVLRHDGRLALSDVVVSGDLPDLPPPIERVLCLNGDRCRTDLLSTLELAGFTVGHVEDHREALLAMWDRATSRVDYEGLLSLFGERGRALLDGVERLEAAVEDGRVSYVSLVARPTGSVR